MSATSAANPLIAAQQGLTSAGLRDARRVAVLDTNSFHPPANSNHSLPRHGKAPEAQQFAQGTPSAVANAFNHLENASIAAANLPFGAMAGAAVLGGVAKGAQWGSDKTGLGFLSATGNGARKASSAIGAIHRAGELVQLRDLASPSTAWGKAKDAARMGDDAFKAAIHQRELTALTAGGADAPLGFAGRAFTQLGDVAQRVDDTVGKPFQRLGGWQQGYALKRMQQGAGAKKLDQLQQALNEHAGPLRLAGAEHVDALHAALGKVRNLQAVTVDAAQPGAVTQHLHEMGRALQDVNAATTKLGATMETQPDTVKTAFKAVTKAAGKVEGQFQKARNLAATGAANLNLKASIAATPGELGRMSLSQGAWAAAAVTGTAAQFASTCHTAHDHIAALERLCGELEGKDKPVGFWHAMTSSQAPDIVKQYRAQIFKKFGVEAVAEAVTGRMSWKFAKGGVSGVAMGMLFAAQMGVSALSSAIVPENPFLPMFKGLSEAHDKGLTISAQSYATLALTAAPKLLERVSSDNTLLQAVTQQYEKEQIAPGQMVAELANGKFNERAAAAKASVEAQKAQAAAHPQPAAGRPTLGTHTARLNGAAAATMAAMPAASNDRQPPAAHAQEVPGTKISDSHIAGRVKNGAAVAVGAA